MKLDSLIDIIKKAQKRHPAFSLRLAEAEALGRWRIAVGELIARHSRAIKVQNSILWVEVEHPIWRSELHYRKNQILDILNGKTLGANKGLSAPSEILKDIFYIDPRGPTGPGLFRPVSPVK
jgi:predicted nucleic acid-binding Zn ribbon protein